MILLTEILGPNTRNSRARRFRAVCLAVMAVGLAGAVLDSSPDIAAAWGRTFAPAIVFAAVFFGVEYVLRWAAAPTLYPIDGASVWFERWQWMTSPLGLFDLIALLPLAFIVMNGGVGRPAQLAAVLWSFKVFRYTPGIGVIGRVFRTAWAPLVSVLVAFGVILLVVATCMHIIEGAAQPETFGSIALSLWWAIVTLTTTGYGDATPVTALGRVLAGGVMICGIGVLALWAGILANAFANEVRRREYLLAWDMISRVSLFHDIDTQTRADISQLLRPWHVNKGTRIFRRGERGESMYFIVSGAIEIRVQPTPVVLGPGEFFGEIALTHGGARTASAYATHATELLVLDIADFRDLAARRPALAQAVDDEAQRRVGTNEKA